MDGEINVPVFETTEEESGWGCGTGIAARASAGWGCSMGVAVRRLRTNTPSAVVSSMTTDPWRWIRPPDG